MKLCYNNHASFDIMAEILKVRLSQAPELLWKKFCLSSIKSDSAIEDVSGDEMSVTHPRAARNHL